MSKETVSSQRAATIYQALYLVNLLLLPGLTFLYLAYLLFFTSINSQFLKIHLIRSVQLSAIAGIFLFVIPFVVVFFSPQFETSLMVMIFYFVTFHAGFVLIGMLNLSRAMVKKLPIF